MELISTDIIQHKIFTIRGVQVMLDKDLASFYGIKPIRLREQVKRNPNRFPKDFVFQLNDNEVEHLVSQNAIPSKQSLGGSLPLVFTEQGVAAVSGVIKNEKADLISVAIARAFVAMRKFLLNNASVFQRLDQVELKQLKTDEKIEQIFKALESGKPEPDKGIFFDGQIFDAYVFVADIIKTILLQNQKSCNTDYKPAYLHLRSFCLKPTEIDYQNLITLELRNKYGTFNSTLRRQ